MACFRNEVTEHTGYAKVELEHLMSWLSTLGGGYSALGDSMDSCVMSKILIICFKNI